MKIYLVYLMTGLILMLSACSDIKSPVYKNPKYSFEKQET